MANPFLGFSADDIETLQGGSGGAFRDFMKRLIRTHMRVVGLPEKDFYSDSNNMKDGGCDVELRVGAKDPAGHLDHPTCWQFKGTPAGNVSKKDLREEITKPYAAQCLRNGSRYVFCIADDITAQKAAEWEGWLDDERKKLNPAAPRPCVYGAEKVAAWCSSYPALVLGYRGLEGFSTFEAWRDNITSPTPKYVAEPQWAGVSDQVRQHVDFGLKAVQVCAVIHGEAGVGKTRLAYESLNGIAGIAGLCLYSMDEVAVIRLATLVANNKEMRVIVVADECLNDTRQKLESLLGGHTERVRVVAINNARERPFSRAVELDLIKLPAATVTKILEHNYPGTPLELRQEAVRLAEGFVKIASDLCQHGIPAGVRALGEYVRSRVTSDAEYLALCALALFTRVGFKGDDVELAGELAVLAEVIGLDARELRAAFERIKASAGFVVIAGRFFYVTPQAVAQHCFSQGWNNWVRDDLPRFHGGLSTNMRASFEGQLKALGSEAERRQFADMVAALVNALTSAELADKKKARQLVSLVETNPDAFLASFRRLIEGADEEIIAGFSTNDATGSTPRRQAIWLCEHLAAFPEYFYDVEAILFRLALTESESTIANNATAIWRQIHRIHLSGSSLPFLTRFAVLQQRFDKRSAAIAIRCFDAATDNLGNHFTRMGSPPVVAGRVPPPDWQPANGAEMSACMKAVLDLFRAAVHSPQPEVRLHATKYFTEHIGLFLRTGLLEFIRSALSAPEIVANHRATIIAALDDFLRFERKDAHPEYVRRVEEWRQIATPQDLEDRMKTLLAVRYAWLPENARERSRPEFRKLAEDLFRAPAIIEKHLAWLNSEEAVSAFELGHELGLIDTHHSLFAMLQAATPNTAPFLRGYFSGILKGKEAMPAFLAPWLDAKMDSDPLLAFHIAAMFPDRLDGWRRILQLAERHRVPPRFVTNAFFHAPSKDAPPEVFSRVMHALLGYPPETQAEGLSAALTLADSWFDDRAQEKLSLPLANDTEFWRLVLDVVAKFAPKGAMDLYHWARLAERVLPIAPEIVIRKATALLEDELESSRGGGALLAKAAQLAPELVMQELGQALLEPKTAIKLAIRGCTHVLVSLPVESVIKWVRADPTKRAKLVASSLPRPFVTEKDEAIVPPLTEAFLAEFGDDPKTVRRFIGGSGFRSHSGDIVGIHRKEAEIARRFRGHRLAAIRDWAAAEEQRANHQAQWWQEQIEEDAI